MLYSSVIDEYQVRYVMVFAYFCTFNSCTFSTPGEAGSVYCCCRVYDDLERARYITLYVNLGNYHSVDGRPWVVVSIGRGTVFYPPSTRARRGLHSSRFVEYEALYVGVLVCLRPQFMHSQYAGARPGRSSAVVEFIPRRSDGTASKVEYQALRRPSSPLTFLHQALRDKDEDHKR